MTRIQTTPNRAAFDVQGAQDLRNQFRNDPQGGLQAAAKQFETMFLQMVLKSMRDTVPSDGLLNSDQTRFYNGMLDQQLAQNLATSGNGVGFARLIEQQLGRYIGAESSEAGSSNDLAAILAGNQALAGMAANAAQLRHNEVRSGLPTSGDYAAREVSKAAAALGAQADNPASAKEFVNAVWPHAVEASRSTGIPPQFLVAHAALESGWGKREITRPDGSNAHNLFGIKAGSSWRGDTVETRTTEYVDGKPQAAVEKFRAYASYAESFQDYARLLRDNPRYGGVIGTQNGTEFARQLQQAGYATDPMYADKLSRIINGPTLRQALIG